MSTLAPNLKFSNWKYSVKDNGGSRIQRYTDFGIFLGKEILATIFLVAWFIAKFVVSLCEFCKLRMGFSVPSITWVGAELMQITMQSTRLAWPAKTKLRMTLDCLRIAKEMAMMRGLFVEVKKSSRLLPETGRSQATNLETQKQRKWIEMHQSQRCVS